MNNEDVKKCTTILLKVIEDNISPDGTLYKIIIDGKSIYNNDPIGGLCGAALNILSVYGYTYDSIDEYMDAISIYTNNCDYNYWFPVYDFKVRLSFLNHIESCLTRNIVELFVIPE